MWSVTVYIDTGGRLRSGMLFLLYKKILQTTSLRDETVSKVRLIVKSVCQIDQKAVVC